MSAGSTLKSGQSVRPFRTVGLFIPSRCRAKANLFGFPRDLASATLNAPRPRSAGQLFLEPIRQFTSCVRRGMFMVGVLPAVLVLYIRRKVPESPSFDQAAAIACGGMVTVLKAHWRLTICAVALMTAFNFFSHGTQRIDPTHLEIEHKFSQRSVSVIAIIYESERSVEPCSVRCPNAMNVSVALSWQRSRRCSSFHYGPSPAEPL